jgi:hypothetical protein
MGRGTCQLGRTAGVEIGEEESLGSVGRGGGWTEEEGRFVATSTMRKLRQSFWHAHVVWEVQSGDILWTDVSSRSL